MPPKKGFKKSFIDLVIDVALARKKISNRMIAKRLGIDEITIRRYRTEYPEFDRAFIEAREMVMEKINRTAMGNLDVRKRKTVKVSPEGKTTITEDVLPTHNDVAVFGKIGLEQSIVPERDDPRDILRDIMKRKIAGKISYLDAVDECEIEGLPVPSSWRAREAQRILSIPRSDEFTAVNVAQLLEASGLPVPRTLMLEVGRVINLPPPVMAEIADMSPEDAADAYRKFMG